MKKRILCYGDSNTWGYVPGVGTRFDDYTRWTGVLQQLLGEDYQVLEAGLNGRTSSFDDPYCDYLNGRKALTGTLIEQKPLDLLILSLGTNDLKYTNAIGVGRGITALLTETEVTQTRTPDACKVFPGGIKILVISPIHLHPQIETLRPDCPCNDKYEESAKLAYWVKRAAEEKNVYFLDAAMFAGSSEVDCVHMDEKSHLSLGNAVARKVKEIL